MLEVSIIHQIIISELKELNKEILTYAELKYLLSFRHRIKHIYIQIIIDELCELNLLTKLSRKKYKLI